MKKLLIPLIVIVFNLSFSQSGKNIFLGVFNGSVVSYLEDIIPYIKIKDMLSYSYAIYMGHIYIFENFRNYPSAYTSAEENARAEFKRVSQEKCKNFKFSLVENFNIKVVELKERGLLFIFSGNIICLD